MTKSKSAFVFFVCSLKTSTFRIYSLRCRTADHCHTHTHELCGGQANTHTRTDAHMPPHARKHMVTGCCTAPNARTHARTQVWGQHVFLRSCALVRARATAQWAPFGNYTPLLGAPSRAQKPRTSTTNARTKSDSNSPAVAAVVLRVLRVLRVPPPYMRRARVSVSWVAVFFFCSLVIHAPLSRKKGEDNRAQNRLTNAQRQQQAFARVCMCSTPARRHCCCCCCRRRRTLAAVGAAAAIHHRRCQPENERLSRSAQPSAFASARK